ncbi:hypothetical protein HF086_017672 [Spodoptera exigua]|uniref:Peptidase S1 domain-containing protein n=1 Tax=Spodoptera exigua TaxID=7107 RepID=A0A922MGT3_SPOEX|nr:hypothetical protein HF086_017672 [Spodoptera exigua]
MKFNLFVNVRPVLAIVNGTNITTPKPYYVYLVKASLSERNYDHWLCGGAIVSKDFVITSAACVEDVDYIYVIAGYSKYVVDEELETDQCTKKMKKRVVYTCVPVSYNFDFDRLEKWSYIDIALAKVESPYDFEDTTYERLCSYKPAIIPINYDPKYQTTDVDSMVMGFGHKSLWRQHGDLENYNSPFLQFSPTLIMNKKDCMKEYQVYPNMTYIIEQYMICTLGKGNIGDGGDPINENFTKLEGCPPAGSRRKGTDDLCEDYNDKDFNFRRKNDKIYNYTTYEYIKHAAHLRYSNFTRRNGICQNDHGGPLVTWVGSREIIIGIASVFKINEENACIGPFLYTSTQCNSAFLDCVLNNPYWLDKPGDAKPVETNKTKTRGGRLDLCDSPPSVKGFDIVKNHISWKDHPAGPAQNELQPETQEFERRIVTEQNYVRNENAELNQQYDPNQQFAANNHYSGQQHQTNEEFSRQQEAVNVQFSERQKYVSNSQYVASQNSAAYAQVPARETNVANEQNNAVTKVAARQRFKVIQTNANREQSISQKYLRIGNPNEQNVQLDPNQQNYQHPEIIRIEHNQQNPVNLQFHSFSPNSEYQQLPQDQESRMYAFRQQNNENGQFNPNQQNVANVPFGPNTEYSQVSSNQQVVPNVPRQQFIANEQFFPYQQTIPNVQFAIDHQSTANRQTVYNNLLSTGNLQFAPNTGNLADVKNGPGQQNIVNRQQIAVFGNRIASKNKENIQYYIRARYYPEIEGFPNDYRIPQERYQGSRMVARIGDEFGDANYALSYQATMPPQNLPYGYG